MRLVGLTGIIQAVPVIFEGLTCLLGLPTQLLQALWAAPATIGLAFLHQRLVFAGPLVSAERAELGERREALLAVTIPERPGSFREFCEVIGARSITEFNYRYSDARLAHVFVGVQMHEKDSERQVLMDKLTHSHYPVVDITDNEMAKLHIRYMVGGRAASVANERVFRFEFPERPGALLRFLSKIGQQWNISLFHYRNHGAAYGRVLVGMQVAAQDDQALQTFFNELGYVYWEETQNLAYRLFLGE